MKLTLSLIFCFLSLAVGATQYTNAVTGSSIKTGDSMANSSGGGGDIAPDYLWSKFNDGSGTTIADSSGNSRSGTISGSDTVWHVGYLDLGAGSSFVTYGSIADFTTQDFSLSAWINPSSLSGNSVYFFKGPFGNGYYCQIGTAGKFQFFANADGTTSNDGDISTSAWQMITITRIGSAIKLFVNGVSVETTAPAITNPNSSGQSFAFGSYQATSNYAPTLVDDLRIYSYGLTPVQVLQIYNANVATHGQ